MLIECTKIKYDTDGEKVKLPSKMVIEIDDDSYECFKEEPDELEEEIGDIITENTGFCTLSFDFKELKA